MSSVVAAYWISPIGKIYEVKHKHINFISSNLELFNLDSISYRASFDKYGEKYSSEANARKELMAKAIHDKWIRIRYSERSHSWSIEVWILDEITMKSLEKWAKMLSEIPGNSFKTMNYRINILSEPLESALTGYVKDLL